MPPLSDPLPGGLRFNPQLQVVDGVVCAVPVSVMDILQRGEWAAEMASHDQPVFADPPLVLGHHPHGVIGGHLDLDVSVGVESPGTNRLDVGGAAMPEEREGVQAPGVLDPLVASSTQAARSTLVGLTASTCAHGVAVHTPILTGSEAGLKAERVGLVPPEYVCGDECEHDEPKPVTDLHATAIDRGWYAEIRHSRGGVVGGTGKQLAVADMWSVRFRRDGWMGYAVRRGAAWSSICVAGVELPPFLKLGLNGLKVWLANPDQPAEWYAEVVRIEAERAAATKAKAAASRAAAGTKRIDHAD
jgi:hypothetical protein